MNRSELESRLRTDAAAVTATAPPRVRRAVLDELRAADAPPTGWRFRPVLLGACAVLVAALATTAVVRTPVVIDGTDAAAAQRPGELAEPLVERAPARVDGLLAAREAELSEELDRVRSDLERLRSLIDRA